MDFKDKLNKKYTLISLYVIGTAIIIWCLGVLSINAPFIFGKIMKGVSWMIRVSKPIVLGFVFAYLLDPIVSFFEQQFKKIKLLKKKQTSCRTYGVIVTFCIVFFALVMLISILVFSVTDQLRLANFDDILVLCNEYVKSFNDLYKVIIERLNELNLESVQLQDYIKGASTYILNMLRGIANNTVISISNLSGHFTTLFFALIITIYFLIDGKMIQKYLHKVSNALLHKKVHNGINSLLKQADEVFSGYIRGQLMDAFVMMILISVTLSVIGVKFSVLIGVLAGIGNLIPYFGPIVAYVLTAVACLLNGQYKQLVIAIILLFIIQTIDGNIIGPKLLSQSIQIHPLLVIISLIFGSAVGGFLGMLLAVPVGAFLKVLFVKFIDERLVVKAKREKELDG